MKFLGILRASALFILLSAFHGPRGIFCSNLEIDPSNESFTVEVSEDHEDSTVESKVIENPSHDSSTLNLSDGSKSLDEVLKELKEKRKAEHEELLKRISEQRTKLVERLSKSDAPFSLEDMTLFLGILRDEADVDPEAVQKVGEEIHAYLGSLGIHGEDAKASLENLMERISKYRSAVKTLIYRPHEQPSPEELIVAGETFEILEQLPKSHAKPHANDHDGTEDSSDERPVVDVPKIFENPKDSTVESSSESSSPLPKSDLVFQRPSWHDSQLASAFLFINEFCSLVNAENFGGNLKVLNDVKDNKDAQWFSVKVKSLCSNFSSRLESLSANLVPSGVTINPYEGVLKSDNFNTYAEWLVKNIPGIRESVQKMFNESKKLNKAQLKTETSMGPSKYGFEFVGDKWNPIVRMHVKDLTWCLRATLEYLQKYLDKILKDPQCENASITKKILSLFSREKKSDVNSQQEDSTVKSQAA
ncbi:secreted antigen 1 [Babesia divergens]|uniref:Secreted antigen 1 n=1 Tax=Babesia divergens TaxID=32595 RepID=A0AAD9GGH2_BABDI|nr:secreted antigen 1 [Babesia divergens]